MVYQFLVLVECNDVKRVDITFMSGRIFSVEVPAARVLAFWVGNVIRNDM